MQSQWQAACKRKNEVFYKKNETMKKYSTSAFVLKTKKYQTILTPCVAPCLLEKVVQRMHIFSIQILITKNKQRFINI